VYTTAEKFREEGQKVCMLEKSVYGLKQAPRIWHQHLVQELARLKFNRLQYADSTFIRQDGGETVIMLVYVDDVLLIASCDKLMSNVKKQLKCVIKVKDLGPVRYFLGVEISNELSGMYLSQSGYIDNIVQRFGMTDS
jgi:Reverse transcriptase (RNA-dependent DNA polymerase)